MRYRVISTEHLDGQHWTNQQVASFHNRDLAIAFWKAFPKLPGYVVDTLNNETLCRR